MSTTKPADKSADKAADKAAPKTAAPPPSHHVRARVFALEFMLAQRVVLSDLMREAEKLVTYLLGAKREADPDQVEARIMAVKVAARGMISNSALIEHARPIEAYILTGKAPAQAAAPVTAGKAPAAEPASRDSQVPGAPGEAGEDIRPQGRPSSRPGMGFEVQVE